MSFLSVLKGFVSRFCRRMPFFFLMTDWCPPISYFWITTKSLNCSALDSSHNPGCVPILKTQKKERCWLIQSHYFHQMHTHTNTPLHAVNLCASSPLVLSHCTQCFIIYMYMHAKTHDLSTQLSSSFLFVFQIISFFLRNWYPWNTFNRISAGINNQCDEHTVDQKEECLLCTRDNVDCVTCSNSLSAKLHCILPFTAVHVKKWK